MKLGSPCGKAGKGKGLIFRPRVGCGGEISKLPPTPAGAQRNCRVWLDSVSSLQYQTRKKSWRRKAKDTPEKIQLEGVATGSLKDPR